MNIHLVDGTYELFRHFFGAPGATSPSGQEVGATRGFLRSMWALLSDPDVTHVAAAFDHTVESFRNGMFDGYKTGEGLEPEIFDQFPLVERAAHALGIVVWPMVEFEADDAIATGAKLYANEPGVERVLLCSPDKDLAQCVREPNVVLFDRRKGVVIDREGVFEKFGVWPENIPDYLALVGDSADGIPGIPRWGAKSTSAVLARYGKLEDIPADSENWDIKVRGAGTLATNLQDQWDDALLYRKLAELREDVPITESVADLEWLGVNMEELVKLADDLGDTRIVKTVGG